MKLLIVGGPGGGQQSVLERLGIEYSLPANPEGVCLEHTFTTKYFSKAVGVWVDQYTDCKEWAKAFGSEEAREVRSALAMVIFVLAPGVPGVPGGVPEEFVAVLGRERPGVPIVGYASEASEASEAYNGCGVDVLGPGELLDEVHLAILEWEAEVPAGEPEFDDPGELMEPLVRRAPAPALSDPMDMGEIMATLRQARKSGASDSEKRALAERLARELVP